MSDPDDVSAEESDEILAERVRAGDSDSYGRLWERHSGAARTAARSFASLADPDDLVSEAFLQILRALQGGGGPREAFRPYLYRTIRNLALNRRQTNAPTSLELVPDMPADGDDLETVVMESTITVRAFRTLPERWQTVLWYTEVEGMQPAEAAPVLGLTPNGVAALAHRAREGLKKAWLQAHVSASRVAPECQWTTQRMSDYSRDALSPAARAKFDAHLESCTRCSILLEEVDDLSRRLASVLLPTVLGGTAAAALLAHAAGGASTPAMASGTVGQPPDASGTVAAANAASKSRHGLLVAAAVVGVVALGCAAFAVDGALDPPVASPGSSISQPESAEPEPTREPSPQPTSSTSPPPVAPPVAPPVDPPTDRTPPTPPVVVPPTTPPPDVTAPTAAAVATPADGALGNDARPPFAGVGEAGARVEIERISGPGGAGVILTTTVPPSGEWAITPPGALPDGVHALRITQVDAAGNRSAPVDLVLTIDTIAAAPVIDPVTGPQRTLPTLVGTAEPGAAVEVQRDGAALGTVTADGAGAWTFQLPDPGPVDPAVVAVQTDVAGNQSAASAPQTIELERPDITVPAPDAVIPSDGGSTVVEVRFGGVPGARVEVLIDGVPTGNIHTLEQSPLIRSTAPLADGTHTIGVRYIDSATGAVGSLTVVTFAVE